MELEETDEYLKDIKRLRKKYKSLPKDLAVLVKVIKFTPKARPPFSYQIQGLKIKTSVIKVKKIASDSFKGRGARSGFRLIYAWLEEEKRIVFVELYHKNEKDTEDRERINRYFG